MDDNQIHELVNKEIEKAVKQTGREFGIHLQNINAQLCEYKHVLNTQTEQLKETNNLFRQQNGRVTAIEHAQKIAELEKSQNCPYKDKIDSVVDQSVALKTINKAVYKAIALTALLAGAALTLLKIYEYI
jgi:hypothetical protein